MKKLIIAAAISLTPLVCAASVEGDIAGCLVGAAFARNEAAIQQLMAMTKNKGAAAKHALQLGEYIQNQMTPEQRARALNAMKTITCPRIGINLS
jgi:hypothetical protein